MTGAFGSLKRIKLPKEYDKTQNCQQGSYNSNYSPTKRKHLFPKSSFSVINCNQHSRKKEEKKTYR